MIQQRRRLGHHKKGSSLFVARLLEALKRHDAAACAALFTDDGLILSPPTVRPRDGGGGLTRRGLMRARQTSAWSELEGDASEELGYCVLAYAGDYLQPDGSYLTDSGRSVNVLEADQW